MALETGDYINDLVITNPVATDPKSAGDDHFRLIKKVLKECLNGFTGGILLTSSDAGTDVAHALTPTTALVAYTTGLMLLYEPNVTNVGAVTVNVSALGAKSIKTIKGADPTAGDIVAGEPLLLYYDGTNFIMLAGTGFVSKTGAQTITGNTTITGTFDATGNSTVGGTFDVTGNATSGGTMDITGNTTVGGTLAVTGDVTGPTQTLGDSSTKMATTAFVATTAMSSALPAQTGNSGKFIATDGTNASWAAISAFADFLDEDNMASDSATKVASQQSIKAYADSVASTASSDLTTHAAAADPHTVYRLESEMPTDPLFSKKIFGV